MKQNRPRQNKALRQLVILLGLLLFTALAFTLPVSSFSFWNTTGLRNVRINLPPPHPLYLRTGPRKVRPANASGLFYPAAVDELFRNVEEMLGESSAMGLKGCRAVLVPHAGYQYSGTVAAASFREVDKQFKRVFILAANHSSAADFTGVSLPAVTHYAIPGAEIPLGGEVDDLAGDPLFVNEPAAHTGYMIEVELPFLHQLRGRPAEPDFTIIPMVVGRLDTAAVSRLAEILSRYADDETLFVFSVDLSHFYSDTQARKLDAYTVQAIMSRDSASLARATTDGNQVLLTMMALADHHDWEATLLLTRNSGDVTGDRNRVVGYSAMAFHEPLVLATDTQHELLSLARKSIVHYLDNRQPPPRDQAMLARHPLLSLPRGVFVTLKKDGLLRGCIGELIASGPLIDTVQSCAIKSAFMDQRFLPVVRSELDQLSISISVLGYPRQLKVKDPAEYLSQLRPQLDGVILKHKARQSTFLPMVWDDLPQPVDFLSRLCLKQGSPANCWQDKATVLYRYGAWEFGEEGIIRARDDNHQSRKTLPQGSF